MLPIGQYCNSCERTGVLFDGEQRVLPEDLADTTGRSQFKSDDGVLHEQERDVVKRWTHGKIVIALLGLENQTKPDENMPLRVFSYEGASYKSQLLGAEETDFYPVITLVLYFGKQRRKKMCLRSAICRRSSWQCSAVILASWRNIS